MKLWECGVRQVRITRLDATKELPKVSIELRGLDGHRAVWGNAVLSEHSDGGAVFVVDHPTLANCERPRPGPIGSGKQFRERAIAIRQAAAAGATDAEIAKQWNIDPWQARRIRRRGLKLKGAQ